MKTRDSIRLGVTCAAVVAAWFLGAASYRNLWFPINVYRDYMGYGQYPYMFYHKDTSAKIAVPCPAAGPRTYSFLAIGQSLASNRSMRGEPDFKARPGAVNFLAGKCYEAADPLLGADYHLGGSPWSRLADLMIASGKYDHVVVGLFAEGNTEIKAWADYPGYTDRVAQLSAEMTAAGIAPQSIPFMLGENDAFYNASPRTSHDEYVERVLRFMKVLHGKGVTAPVYIAEETICANGPYEPVASAQRDVANGADIRRGAVIDKIGFEGRWDGCHLTATGRQRAAELWRDALIGTHNDKTVAK